MCFNRPLPPKLFHSSLFSQKMPANEIKKGSLQAWLAAIRPKTFGIALAPVLVGITASLSVEHTGNLPLALLTILVAVGIQALTNMENDVGYTKRKAERSNRKGFPRATSEGWLSIRQVDVAIRILATVLILVSVALVTIGGWIIVLMGVCSVAAAYLYMGGRKPIAYSPWGEFTVFIFFGMVAVNGTYYLQSGTFSFISLALGAACGAIAAGVLAVNNWRDMRHDASVGRRTLAVVLGEKKFPRLYLCLLLAPFALVLATVSVWPEHAAYLLSLIPIYQIKKLYGDFLNKEGYELNDTMLGTIKLEIRFAFLLSLGALLDTLIHCL